MVMRTPTPQSDAMPLTAKGLRAAVVVAIVVDTRVVVVATVVVACVVVVQPERVPELTGPA